MHPQHSLAKYGRVPEWPKGADCKSASSAFGGSNPPPSTTQRKSNLNRVTLSLCMVGRWTNKIFLQKKILFANQREALVPKDAQDRVRYPLSATILIYKYITNCTKPTRSVSFKGRARPRPLSTLRDYIDLQVYCKLREPTPCVILPYGAQHNPYNRKTRQDNIA